MITLHVFISLYFEDKNSTPFSVIFHIPLGESDDKSPSFIIVYLAH